MVTAATTTTPTSNSIHSSSSTSNGLSNNNANMMNNSNDRNASAVAGGKVRGTSSVWANIVKGEPNVVVAAPPPASSPKKAASSSVSQVNQKIDSSATASVADDSNTNDVKSASTSSSKSACNHNDNINCTSNGGTAMGVKEKEPSGSPSSHTASDSAVADTNAAAAVASTPSTATASVKKPAAAAWKKPSFNGTTTANAEAGLVIGDAFSWPALSEAANNNVRGSTKSPSPSPSPTPSYSPSPSDSSLKPLSLSQVSHVATSSSQSQKQSSNHANHNPTSHHASTSRQRSMKRGTNTPSNTSGGGALMNGGLLSQSQSSSAGVSVEKPQKNSFGTPASTVPDSSTKDSSHKMNNLERGSRGRGGFASQPDQSVHQHNSSFRRGSGGPHPRGDGHGPYRPNQNHMGRREHDHRDWNSHRSFNGRDAQQHQQMHPRIVNPRNSYIRPPPVNVNGAFIAPPQPVPLRPFVNAMGYPDMPSPVYFVADPLRGVPFLPAPPVPMFFHGTDPNTLAKQIEYYFSSANLCKDSYLRHQMDEQGWVHVSVIAVFRRVEELMKGMQGFPDSSRFQFILDSVRASTNVETRGDRIRKRNDWMNWTMPPTANNSAPIPAPESVGIPEDGNSANADMNNHLQRSNGEGTSEGTL